jgi:hypothetical protein
VSLKTPGRGEPVRRHPEVDSGASLKEAGFAACSRATFVQKREMPKLLKLYNVFGGGV